MVLPNILKNPLLEDFAGKWRSFVWWQLDPFSIFFPSFSYYCIFYLAIFGIVFHAFHIISPNFTHDIPWHPMTLPLLSLPISSNVFHSSMLFARSCCFFFSLASWSFSLASAARSTITSVKHSKAVTGKCLREFQYVSMLELWVIWGGLIRLFWFIMFILELTSPMQIHQNYVIGSIKTPSGRKDQVEHAQWNGNQDPATESDNMW